MRACYIDVNNHIVKEHAMTWEKVDDTFLSGKSCFPYLEKPNYGKKKKISYYSYVHSALDCLYPHQIPAPTLTLPSTGAHPDTPVNSGQLSLCLWIEVLHILTKGEDNQASGWNSMPKVSLCFSSSHSRNTFWIRQDS